MVPTLLFVGLPFGLVGIGPARWWIVPVAAIAWPALLLLTGVDSGLDFVLGASLIGAANTAAGCAVGLLVSRVARGAVRYVTGVS